MYFGSCRHLVKTTDVVFFFFHFYFYPNATTNMLSKFKKKSSMLVCFFITAIYIGLKTLRGTVDVEVGRLHWAHGRIYNGNSVTPIVSIKRYTVLKELYFTLLFYLHFLR